MTDRRNVMLGLVAGMSGLAALSQAAGASAAVSEAEAQGAIDSFFEALFSGDPAKVEQVLGSEFQILRADGRRCNSAVVSILTAEAASACAWAISPRTSTSAGAKAIMPVWRANMVRAALRVTTVTKAPQLPRAGSKRAARETKSTRMSCR
jgi:hypothetical protein